MVKWREDLSDGGAKAMIDLALAREQAALLAAAMERHSPVRELEDGYALFRDKRVTHAWKDRFNIVHAIVRTEEGDRKLQIDLDFFLASECGCSRGFRICAHMAAVFFLLYGEHDDPAAWLAEVVRSRERASGAAGSGRTGPVPSAGPGGGTSGNAAGVASIGTPSMPPARPEAGRSVPPHRWGTLVDRELQRLLGLLGDRKRIDIFYLNACRKLHALTEGFSAGERAAFRLFAALRVMLHADRRAAALPDRKEAPGALKMIRDLGLLFEEQAAHAAEMLAGAGMPPDAPRNGPPDGDARREGWRLVLEQARAALPPPGRPTLDWERVHRLLWTRLFTDPALRRGEIRRLGDLAARAADGETAGRLRLAVAHLHWLEGDDEAAMAEWTAAGRPSPERLVTCLEALLGAGSWPRFKAWLDFAVPHLQRADGDTFRRALDVVRAYRDATGDDETLRGALTGLMPRSAHAYAAYLIETGRLEEWAAFHMLHGTPPDRIDREQRLAVEQRAPRLMLPLYHQAIERLLAEKSRAAYRESAKLARRLQSLYRALGEEETFRAFVGRLEERNGRQRALMEEWRKGNLLA